MNDIPFASVIIVTWNSTRYLSSCLAALVAQNYKNFEVVLVDNGSTDGGLDSIENHWPTLRLHVERLGKNEGFSVANNIGAGLARGQWLALLNPDAFPEPDWLEELLDAAKKNPEYSCFASRQLQANAIQFLDGAGDTFHISGLAWRRFAGLPASQFGKKTEEVFSPCAAAALYSRQAFLQVGGFDENFFTYHEDVDLGFRLRLRGCRCLYVPQAVVHHIGSASTGSQSDFAIYHWQRNFIWCFIQNMPSTLFWVSLPSHLLANIIYIIYFTLRGQGNIIWKAKIDAILGLSRALHKRGAIQKNRTISSQDLLRTMENGPLQPYLIGFRLRKKIR